METKTDRRVLRTRRLLLEGLTTLLLEKDVSQISVKELSDYADINRGTFYLHYKDVYDMLTKVEEELFEKFEETLDKSMIDNANPSPETTLYEVFALILENQTMVKALLGPHGDMTFLAKMKLLVKEKIKFVWSKEQLSMANFEYFNSFIIYGCIGLIDNWISNQCKPAPEEMAHIAGKTIQSGLSNF